MGDEREVLGGKKEGKKQSGYKVKNKQTKKPGVV